MRGSWEGRAAFVFLATAAHLALCGCAHERSFPIESSPVITVAAEETLASHTTRTWLQSAQQQLAHLAPRSTAAPLLTDDLTGPDGLPVDVYAHFGVKPDRLNSLLYNAKGILESAQATGTRFGAVAPSWPEFDDVWIPVNPNREIAGRLGLARRDGQPIHADCIVILAGISGDNCTLRTRDVAAALRNAGLHVLALEQRGHGRTEVRYPETPYTFGSLETADLLEVSHWLRARPEVRETGLIGFCWGANEALVAAWKDGRADDDPLVPAGFRRYLKPRSGGACFRAGVIAFSPAIGFDALLDRLDQRWTVFSDPVAAALGKIVDGRSAQKGYPDLSGNLRSLLKIEAHRAAPDSPAFYADGVDYVRLAPRSGAAHTKLDAARMPVLVVHAVDDPVGLAQPVVDLISRVGKPNVAAVVLPGGGHCGFAPHARAYFYSLMLSFFDPQGGAAACVRKPLAALPQPE